VLYSGRSHNYHLETFEGFVFFGISVLDLVEISEVKERSGDG